MPYSDKFSNNYTYLLCNHILDVIAKILKILDPPGSGDLPYIVVTHLHLFIKTTYLVPKFEAHEDALHVEVKATMKGWLEP